VAEIVAEELVDGVPEATVKAAEAAPA